MKGSAGVALAAALVLAACQGRAPVDGKLTQAEIEAVRVEVMNCWLVDPGLRGLPEMSADMLATLTPNGSVLSVTWETPDRYKDDPNYQVFAISARDAILSCSPLELPPEEYAVWKRMTFHFNAREMLGL